MKELFTNMNCIFCKIASKEIAADIIHEDDKIIAFRDIHPLAPVHILVIPKKHFESTETLADEDRELVGQMIIIARNIARQLQISSKGYKLLIRTGPDGGQEVPHLHLHLIGGARLYEEIRAV